MAEFKSVDVQDAGGKEIHKLMDVNGMRFPTFSKPPAEIAEIIQNLVSLPIRDDDILFCSPAKSGTHWLFEILFMLLNGKAETIPFPKIKMMVELIPQSLLVDYPSPRVLNTHVPLSMMPNAVKEKRTKVILILRNPKDVCVSLYNHHKGFKNYDYDGKFSDYLPLFLNGQLDYGDWFDYVLKMEEEMNKGEYNMHLVYYEDLKENGPEELKRLAKFLNITASDALCQAICEKCDIRNMSKDKALDPAEAKKKFRDGFSIYRKGQIGDWKNYFTVAMSEEFDKYYEKRMKDSKLKF